MSLIELGFPAALLGLLLLLPIIILYLMKPKPKKMRFPSVMFILDAERKRRLRTFLKKIIRDPLLVLQLLIIAFLVIALAAPFVFMPADSSVKENAVIVLDSSASMQATDLGKDRFTRAGELARELIEKMNPDSSISIVLAENVPIILAKNLSKKDALAAIDYSFAGDTPSNLADSLVFCKDLFSASDINKRVYVLSDYSSVDDTDIRLAQKMLVQSNISISYVKTKGDGKNIAITDLKAKRFITDRKKFYMTYIVKNYYETEKEVTSGIIIDGNTTARITQSIPGGKEKLFSYEAPLSEQAHEISVKLSTEDSLALDDEAYAYLPLVKRYSVLLITKDRSDPYLRYALEASKDISLRTSILPVIPSFEGFDTIVIGDLDEEFLLPGTFQDLLLFIEDGGHVIYTGSEDLAAFDRPELAEMLPVKLGDIEIKDREVSVVQDHEILDDIVPKGSESFPNVLVQRYIKTEEKNGSHVIAKIDESPVIAYAQYGAGKVAYIGINPVANWSNFHYSANFPVFWIQFVDWINRDENTLGINNFRTGDYLPLSEGAEITSPSGETIKSRNLLLDDTGFYRLRNGGVHEELAVSLLDEDESDITRELDVGSIQSAGSRGERSESVARRDFSSYLLIALLALFLAELYYYRRRGLL